MTNTESGLAIGRYCDLMNDVAFQWIFGREENKDLLIALLSGLITDRRIKDVRFYKQRQMPFSKELKKSVFDVSCRTDDGSYIDVEVQVRKQDRFADRCLYYSTFNIQGQIRESAEEYGLKPVYVVSIDGFTRNHGDGWDGRVLSHYVIEEREVHEMMTDSLHFIYVELPAFNRSWEEIDNDKDRFLYCIKHLHEMDELPEGFTDGIWQRFTRQCELAEMPAEVKEEYISTMTTEIDRRAQEKYAQKEARKLREEIRKEREEMLKEKSQLRKEKSQLHEEKNQLCKEKSQLREEKSQLREEKRTARAEGRAEGREEGELKAKLDDAGKLKAAGIPIDIICQCTGLSPEQVSEL